MDVHVCIPICCDRYVRSDWQDVLLRLLCSRFIDDIWGQSDRTYYYVFFVLGLLMISEVRLTGRIITSSLFQVYWWYLRSDWQDILLRLLCSRFIWNIWGHTVLLLKANKDPHHHSRLFITCGYYLEYSLLSSEQITTLYRDTSKEE